MEMVNSFKRYLRAIVPKIVYKSAREAEKYETDASRLSGDDYVGACLQTDDWFVIREDTLTTGILNKAGVYDAQLIAYYQADSYRLPDSLRERIIKLRRKEIIDNYEEQNNYYRMLAGLPDLDADFIYLSPSDLAEYGYFNDAQEDYDSDNLENLTPIHELPQSTLNAMDKDGYLDGVYEIYNDGSYHADYIKHLGLQRIPFLQARTAGHFELLYVPRPDNANRFNRDFILYYEEARQYFLNQIYNFNYSFSYDFYESYMGFFILVMAIQRMVDSMFEVMVERDFYDLETCRMFLSAYGVPWVDILTFHQQKALVKNLNILIMEKCTSQVLYDILSLIEYDTYELTKYLLVKQHKTAQLNDEEEPKPIFVYRSVLDEDGNASYELDKTLMYDYYFVGVPMNETDIKLSEFSGANAHSYESVTVPDSLWIEDRELVQKLQDAEINYMETKYTNVAITVRMQDVLFEHIYLQKLLCDKANETSNIMVDISLISSTPISLLELEVMLICLMARYNHMEPDLLTSPSQSLAVLGFNFDADLEAIKEEIRSHPRIYSQKILKYIQNIRFLSASDVNEMYRNVRDLARFLTATMQTTTSEIVYHAYKKLYLALLITDVHNEVFTLSDGTLPQSYMDWLEEKNHYLYAYIDKLDSEACVDKINYVTTKMSTLFADADFLKYLNPIDMTVINGIIRLLRWFKSYTIEIKEMEVVYLFDSKYYNLMKMMSRMWFHQREVIREIDIGYHEWIQTCSAVLMKKELRNKLFDILRMSEHMTYHELSELLYDKFHLYATIHTKDFMSGWFSDVLMYFEGSGYMELSELAMKLIETVKVSGQFRIDDNQTEDGTGNFQDKIITMSTGTLITRELMLNKYADVMHIDTKHVKFVDDMHLFEKVRTSYSDLTLTDLNPMKDMMVRAESGSMSICEYAVSKFIDTLCDASASAQTKETMTMKDTFQVIIHDS